MDASLLRWWDGATWTQQTMPAEAAVRPSSDPFVEPATVDVPPVLSAVPPLEEAYVPPNSVFRMSDSSVGDAYNPEWSALADISDEVALSGVPVQLSLTAGPSEPPIPVSADVFPMLRAEALTTPEPAPPAWQVEAPLAKPIDQLFPMAAASATVPPVTVAPPVAAAPVVAAPVAAVLAAMPDIAAPVASTVTATSSPSLSPEIFPIIAPSTAPVAEADVPLPAGDAFPGLVPSVAELQAPVAAPAPTIYLEPEVVVPEAVAPVLEPVEAPVDEPVEEPVEVAAPVDEPVEEPADEPVEVAAAVAAPVEVAAPLAAPPAEVAAPLAAPASVPEVAPLEMPAPAEVIAANAAQEAALYTGPPPVQLATNPEAPADFQPFAASTPGASYVPLEPRPIPQPVQLGAPAPTQAPPADQGITVPTPVGVVATQGASETPTEYWPTQGTPPPGGAYQPTPGSYVPFDPNAVHLQPVIPFSSRDPYNSASTARPGMRAYAAAPVGPSGSTWTGGLAFILVAPILQAVAYFVWTQLTTTAGLSLTSVTWLPWVSLAIGLFGLAAAQLDRSALARRGYFDLASPFWVLLLPPLVYLIVRATRLHRQGKGSVPAIGLWALSYAVGIAAITVLSFVWLSAPTPVRVAEVQTSIQEQLAAKNVKATVTCPTVTSFAPGSTFDCTASTSSTPSTTVPFRVTIMNWNGGYTVTSLSGSGATTS